MRKARSVGVGLLVCVLFTIVPWARVSGTGAPLHGEGYAAYQRVLQDEIQSAGVPAGEPLTAASTAWLPIIANNYRPRPACTAESPFGLQIAALHEIVPRGVSPDGPVPKTEADWWALYGDSFPRLVDALEASGACWARLRVDWSLIQPNPPPAAYVWEPYHDDKLRLIAETGVRILATIDGVPSWAGPVTRGPIYSDRLDEFVQFLTDVVNRYKQPPYNIHDWELFNEPDKVYQQYPDLGWGFKGAEYAQMMALAYGAIKAADPTATVTMGGLAYDGFIEYGEPELEFNRYFADDVMAAGGGAHVDVLNIHYFPAFYLEWERWVPEGNPPTCGIVDDGIGTPYEGWGVDIIAKLRHFENRMSTCFGVNKPLWLTELGQHGWPDDAASLADQSRYVIQGPVRALSAGAGKVIWFALVSPPYDIYEQGLLYQADWSPKPAFDTFYMLSTELDGYRYASGASVPGVEGYLFNRAGYPDKRVVWSRDPQTSASMTFDAATRLRIVHMDGTVTIVNDGGTGDQDKLPNGSIRILITQDPVLVSRL